MAAVGVCCGPMLHIHREGELFLFTLLGSRYDEIDNRITVASARPDAQRAVQVGFLLIVMGMLWYYGVVRPPVHCRAWDGVDDEDVEESPMGGPPPAAAGSTT
jgi:hypothetical protein